MEIRNPLLEKKRKQLLAERQKRARESQLQMRRNARPMPMMINKTAAVPRRSPSPVRRPERPSLGGIMKKKTVTIKNDSGRTFALRKRETTVAKSCTKVFTGTQEGAICWFAAIFTSLFFSQFIRVVMKLHANMLLRDPASSEFAKAILEILKGYSGGHVSQRVVNHLQPRQFLMDLRKYRPDYFTSMYNGTDEAHYSPYQHALLAFLKVRHLNIGFVNGRLVYSGFNVDLPLDSRGWKDAMSRQGTKGTYVDTNKPEVIIIHRDAGEDYVDALFTSPTPPLGRIEGFNPNEHASVIRYNGMKYILDSCIIGSELRTSSCSVAHAIAGVTCNNERYIYNGWTAKTKDPAMKGAATSSVVSDRPCALYKYPWDKNRNFVINLGACRFDNARQNQHGKELVFNAVSRSSVVYVRADIVAKTTVKAARFVPPTKVVPPRKLR